MATSQGAAPKLRCPDRSRANASVCRSEFVCSPLACVIGRHLTLPRVCALIAMNGGAGADELVGRAGSDVCDVDSADTLSDCS